MLNKTNETTVMKIIQWHLYLKSPFYVICLKKSQDGGGSTGLLKEAISRPNQSCNYSER